MIPVHYYFILSIIFLSILTSIEAGLYLVLRYRTGLALWAGLILFSQAFELVGYLLYWIKPADSMVHLISLAQIFFYTLFCIFWLIFVFIFTRHSAWIRLRNLILIIALPCAYLLMMTALWIQGSVMDPTAGKIVGSLMLSPFTSGLPGSLFIIFVYGVAIFSSLVLLRFFSKSNPVLRMMALPLLVGPNLLALVAALELAGIHPIQPLSIHQLAIASMTLLAFWAVFDLRFGSVLSSARETVIDQMQDGVLILDQQDRLIDINAAAQHILGSDGKNALKQNIIKIWPQGAALISGQSGTNFSIGEAAIQVDGLEYTYDISISKLLDAYQESVGRVVVLRNITKRELMEKSLKERTQELQHTNAFLTAMSQAMGNIQRTTEPARVLDIMGNELYAIGLKCFIAQLEPDSNELVVSYVHSGENALAGIGRLLGDRVIGYRLKRDRFLKLYKLVEGRENSYRDQLIKGISSFEDQEFSQKIKQIMGLIGLKLDITTIVVRLVAGERVLGLMGVWGDDLRETDIAPLNMFANQVAIAIMNSRLYDQAQKEIITRTQAESRIREALGEKEVLLKEVHHRVKNNLQIISSLLNLQADQVKDTGTLRALRDSQSRVRSMALIHEKLYQSQSLAKIDFAEYVQSLTKDLFRSYQRTLGKIRLNIHADQVSLDLDYAVPCGLILNELMTNTLKYAFPDERDGSIWIELRAEPDQTLILRVADDGIGLPAGLDILKNKSLGLQLVNSLVKQIDGTLVVENSSGTAFQVSFKV